MSADKVIIGNSDYTRKEIENGAGWVIGNPVNFLQTIRAVEREGYTVKFETSLFRKILCVSKYRVVGYKTKKP